MTDKPARPKIILIRETTRESWKRDASTFALFVGLIGIGILCKSDAMQWTGAIVGFVTIIAICSGRREKCTFTIEAARTELDRLEKVS